MNTKVERVLLSSGTNPRLKNIPRFQNTEDMLLYGAWVQGMHYENTMYRRSLFHYVQTHIAPKAEDDLQRVIESSSFFTKEKQRDGLWLLTEKGLKAMEKFGETPAWIDARLDFEFISKLGKYEIKIHSFGDSQQFKIYCNGRISSGAALERRLISENILQGKLSGGSSPLKIFNYIIKNKEFTWRIINLPLLKEFLPVIQEEDDDVVFKEGQVYYSLHRKIERDGDLVKKAKEISIVNDPMLRCEICKFSFLEKYGEVGKGFIEAHHIIPVSELKETTNNRPEDLIMVCSNCHKMLHRKRPWINHDDLKKLLNE